MALNCNHHGCQAGRRREKKLDQQKDTFLSSCCMGSGLGSAGLTAQAPVESSLRAKACRFLPALTEEKLKKCHAIMIFFFTQRKIEV